MTQYGGGRGNKQSSRTLPRTSIKDTKKITKKSVTVPLGQLGALFDVRTFYFLLAVNPLRSLTRLRDDHQAMEVKNKLKRLEETSSKLMPGGNNFADVSSVKKVAHGEDPNDSGGVDPNNNGGGGGGGGGGSGGNIPMDGVRCSGGAQPTLQTPTQCCIACRWGVKSQRASPRRP